jgi:hypothetical protein
MTPVVEIGNGGISTYAHLCARHQSDRRGAGWWVKPNERHASGPCDDCVRSEQLAPGYVTPTVRFFPTAADAFAPAPGWKRDPPMKPWPRAEYRKKSWARVENEILAPVLAEAEAEVARLRAQQQAAVGEAA